MSVDFESPPHCPITYAALRAAFVTTLDSLLRYSLDPLSDAQHSAELFDCFPTLKGTAPQVQLECLFRTWERWSQGHSNSPDLLDNVILFAAYESLARMTNQRQNSSLKVVLNGPKAMPALADHWITSKARCLQTATPRPPEGTLLREIFQIEDPVSQLGSNRASAPDSPWQELLELVGRWTISRELILESKGLLTQDEQDILRVFFEEHPALVR